MIEALKKHVVFRVATIYVLAGWLLIQFADISLEAFEAPAWIMRLFLIAILGGFPVALIASWIINRGSLGGVVNTVITLFSLVFAALLSGLAYQVFAPAETITAAMSEQSESAIESNTRSSIPVVAILPLNNMSADENNEYLADGMTEDIITLLAQSPGLEVIARNSTFKYKNTNPDIRDVGRDLNADYVVEGSIRPVGDRLRVTLQVIDAFSGSHIWAEQIDKPMAEFFDIQDEVTLGIAAAVGDAVFRTDYKQINQSRTENLTAWALTSRVDVITNSPKFRPHHIDEMRRVVELDPDYALAKAVLARALTFYELYSTNHPLENNLALKEAEALAREAYTIAPDDPKVAAYLAITLTWAGKPESALPIIENVPMMSPSYAEGLALYGDILIHNGRAREGMVQLRRALELTPLAPQRTIYEVMLCEGHILEDEWLEAERRLEDILLNFGSNNAYANRYMAGVKLQLGKREEAIGHLSAAIETSRSLQKEEEVLRFITVDTAEHVFVQMFEELLVLERELELDNQK